MIKANIERRARSTQLKSTTNNKKRTRTKATGQPQLNMKTNKRTTRHQNKKVKLTSKEDQPLVET